jgi:aspartate--ammonia ligase
LRINLVLQRTKFVLREYYPELEAILPDEIIFIHTEEALARYPDLGPKEREKKLAEEYGVYFLIGIGGGIGQSRPCISSLLISASGVAIYS